jgi:hypothetical protein
MMAFWIQSMAAKLIFGGCVLLVGSFMWCFMGSSGDMARYFVATVVFFLLGIILVVIGAYVLWKK